MTKRLVLQYPDGTMQIFARMEDGDDVPQPASLVTLPGIGPINLVASKRSYYLYKPVMAPQTSSDYNPISFNPEGGTTTFSGGQR